MGLSIVSWATKGQSSPKFDVTGDVCPVAFVEMPVQAQQKTETRKGNDKDSK